jgi:hypothetical protein
VFGAAAKPFGLGGFGGGGVGGFGTGGQVPLVDKYHLSKQGLASLFAAQNKTLSDAEVEELMLRINAGGDWEVRWDDFRTLIHSSSVDRMTDAWQSFRSSSTGEAMASMGVCSPGVLYNILLTHEQQLAQKVGHSFGPRSLTRIYLDKDTIQGKEKTSSSHRHKVGRHTTQQLSTD